MEQTDKRSSNYYLGLIFLLLSVGSLLVCIFKENFRFNDFIIFLFFFTWGFGLLWRSDFDVKTAAAEKEIAQLKEEVDRLERKMRIMRSHYGTLRRPVKRD